MTIKESNKLYYFKGESHTLKDWAKLKNCKWQILYRRLYVKKMPFWQAYTEELKS